MWSKDFFVKSLKQNNLPLDLSKSYYYLSLIKCIENNTKEAKDYLNSANFWEDEKHLKKITDLRVQIARSAFVEEDYFEVLNQHNQIDNVAPTAKQIADFWFLKNVFHLNFAKKCKSFDHGIYEKYMLFDYQINAQVILNRESAVIKFLCLNKLGYKVAADQLFKNLIEDRRDNVFMYNLLDISVKNKNDESICVLYKMLRDYGIYFNGKNHKCNTKEYILPYLSSQFLLHNFEEGLAELETYLSGEIDNHDLILTLPRLIGGYSKFMEREIIEIYLEKYINVCEKFLDNKPEKQSKQTLSDEEELIKLSNELILDCMLFGENDKEIVEDFIKKIHSTSLPISCYSHIRIAQFFSLYDKHQTAYDYLLKSVNFTKGIKPKINDQPTPYKKTSKVFEDSHDYKKAHAALKTAHPQILDSLLQLKKWVELDNFVKYIRERHEITIKPTEQTQRIRVKAEQGKHHKEQASEQDISRSVRQHIVKSFCEESTKIYQEAQILIKSIEGITLPEWQKLKDITSEVIIAKAQDTFNLCMKDFETLNTLLKENVISSDIVEKARQVYNNFNKNIFLLNQMLSKPLIEISVLRKKEANRKFLENTYQINESDFLERSGSRVNYRASQKLLELQRKQKQALIEAQQKLRKESRAHLEKEHQENSLGKEHIEVEISPDALLVECNILPFEADDYSLKHSTLLHQILSKKFDLNDRDQETLRIILTKGERAFQITLNDIIKLFSKFEGFTDDVHHGGSHEKVSGMGLTLMPNANGIKKGSYWGQIEEAKEKIITIIAKTLMVKDL